MTMSRGEVLLLRILGVAVVQNARLARMFWNTEDGTSFLVPGSDIQLGVTIKIMNDAMVMYGAIEKIRHRQG